MTNTPLSVAKEQLIRRLRCLEEEPHITKTSIKARLFQDRTIDWKTLRREELRSGNITCPINWKTELITQLMVRQFQHGGARHRTTRGPQPLEPPVGVDPVAPPPSNHHPPLEDLLRECLRRQHQVLDVLGHAGPARPRLGPPRCCTACPPSDPRGRTPPSGRRARAFRSCWASATSCTGRGWSVSPFASRVRPVSSPALRRKTTRPYDGAAGSSTGGGSGRGASSCTSAFAPRTASPLGWNSSTRRCPWIIPSTARSCVWSPPNPALPLRRWWSLPPRSSSVPTYHSSRRRPPSPTSPPRTHRPPAPSMTCGVASCAPSPCCPSTPVSGTRPPATTFCGSHPVCPAREPFGRSTSPPCGPRW